MPEEWNKKFAFYAAALYRLGNHTEAALVGCIMFEKAIYHLLMEKDIDQQFIVNNLPPETGKLQYAINLVCKIYNFDYALRSKLHELRRKRNDITHVIDINLIERQDIENMILFVWRAFDQENFLKDNCDANNIDFLKADYAIREMHGRLDEPVQVQEMPDPQHEFHGFEDEDFQELYRLRQKIISLGSKITDDMLNKEYEVFGEIYKSELGIDIISKVDTTSAYVWMSMNQLDERRQRIKSASPSILATPLDLRIYFDIGGQARQLRQKYYDFLKSPSFKDFKEKNDSKNIEIFDVDWYSFIFNRKSLSELTDKDMKERIAKAEEKLANSNNDDSPISWNRLLCGYIIERRKIPYNEILEKLDVIIKFYYHFEHFRESKN